MTDLQLSNLNDWLAIALLRLAAASLFALLLFVLATSFLDSRTGSKRYLTDVWFMRIAVVFYDAAKNIFKRR